LNKILENKTVELGKKVPAFSVIGTNELTFKLSDYKEKNIVLYFYPKDATSGCTLEGQDFRDNMTKFKRRQTVVFGISRDTLKLHEKFKENQSFNFELLSDEDELVCTLFDVIKMKNMYGKKVRGIERSTFLIDKKGKLQQEWRKVKVSGHVDEILEAITALNVNQK